MVALKQASIEQLEAQLHASQAPTCAALSSDTTAHVAHVDKLHEETCVKGGEYCSNAPHACQQLQPADLTLWCIQPDVPLCVHSSTPSQSCSAHRPALPCSAYH